MSNTVSHTAASDLTGKLSSALRDPLMRNSMAIMSSTVLTSLLGYVFWMISARHFSPDVNGTAAATTSAIAATVLIASVGGAAALVEWLPRCTTALEWRQRVTTGIVVAAVAGLIGAIAVAGVLGFGLRTLPQVATPIGAVLFCTACVFFAVGQVIDYIAVAEHRGSLLLLRNLVLCGLRIPLLFIPVATVTGADTILLAWTVAAALSLVWVAATFGARSGKSLRLSFDGLGTNVRQMASALVGQHLITVSAMLAGYVLPIVVYTRLSATENAYFYITWMLGSVFFMISPAVSAGLFVEGAANPSDIRALVRRCVVIVAVLLAVPMIVYLTCGRLILGMFGTDYVTHGYALLLLLTASAIPDAITNIAVAVLRVTGRMPAALALNGGMLIACVGAAWFVLPLTGIAGAGLCWIASQAVGALWVLARWRRIVDSSRPAAPHDGDFAAADASVLSVEGGDH
jgi:O-antigen/teichoic acid export membrane protein